MLRPLVGIRRLPFARQHVLLARRLIPRRTLATSAENDTTDVVRNEGLPDDPPKEPFGRKDAWIYLSGVFPIRFGVWDFRYIIARLEKEDIIDQINSLIGDFNKYNFQVLAVEGTQKDGGVFIHFEYDSSLSPSASSTATGTPGTSPPSPPIQGLSDFDRLKEIEVGLRKEVEKKGGLPTWKRYGTAHVWLVRGKPWREDLYRFPSPQLKVEFDGPDVDHESLYDILRPYGRIADMSVPVPVPAGTLRSSTVRFIKTQSATIARNCLHGIAVAPHAHDLGAIHGIPADGKLTRLRLIYEKAIKDHMFRDWISNHPRIVLPVAAFLLATLTYTIFDPVRAWFVEAKVLDWFDYRNYSVVRWLKRNTIERLSFDTTKVTPTPSASSAWRERQDAARDITAFLGEQPSNFALVTGPEGSGKGVMVAHALSSGNRHALTIDCAELCKATSDAALISELAKQTGYWPIFSMLSSINNLLDLASVGLIGQKAGFSTSIDQQMKQVLEVVGKGLEGVSKHHKAQVARREEYAKNEASEKEQEEARSELIRLGAWHDGRIDCVAGNGIMSELGFGDELLRESDYDAAPASSQAIFAASEPVEGEEKKKLDEEKADLGALPVVVMKNWALKGAKKDELWDVLSAWAAALVENKVAQVIFVSDNSSAPKNIAKALPSKPITTITLTDATAESALGFVTEKLKEAGVQDDLSADDCIEVRRLGGRLTDLESFVYKVRNGLTIAEAVEDIISRNVAEVRKNAFGDDAEDASNLPWTTEQAWGIFKRLAEEEEIPYADVLLDYPFKGNETALRELEHDEFINITQLNGRPNTIRAGKPVFYSVFQRLTSDKTFAAMQDIAYNEKAMAAAESAIRSAEQELNTLTNIGVDTGLKGWILGATGVEARASWLLRKIETNEKKLEILDAQNDKLKALLKKGE
ncbi:exonuclease [Calocera viscosa TUFC12733]|uniref:Mitochondrial escape protein 2 n=1 Tax=Calocera viscosa (strain TUFC12733) TaxID=1330018 RepID=A0A167Q4Z2_CALVF|nr:exonuclease [Calocera viscosa TUFC12733]